MLILIFLKRGCALSLLYAFGVVTEGGTFVDLLNLLLRIRLMTREGRS